ncbi:hypothetical protein C8R43DRAFT_1129701 [Mycena crocata]|nr:hypothetical protein C8R43DRAFT_1129701 [Mycena crocata]
MQHFADPIARCIDPRFPSLVDDDFRIIRRTLPFVTGLRILQYGEVELLVKGKVEEVLVEEEWPLSIGGLEYFVASAGILPSSHLTPYGTKVRTGAHRSGACLGIKIRGPDGQLGITAVTHAFVPRHPVDSPSVAQKIYNAFVSAPLILRQSFSYFLPRHLQPLSPMHTMQQVPLATDFPITFASQWATKMYFPLLGVEVFTECVDDCVRRRADIGMIRDIYDFPSEDKPYPTGYMHDLSIIRGSDLPEIVALPPLPQLLHFVPHKKIFNMRERAIFTVTYPVIGSEETQVFGQLLAGKTVDCKTRESLLTGSQFLFDEESASILHTVLWRSTTKYCLMRPQDSPDAWMSLSSPASADGDYLSATGYSGSVLCAGPDQAAANSSPIPVTAEVLGFG